MARPIAWGAGSDTEAPRAWGGSRGIVLTGYLRRIDKKIRMGIDRGLAPFGLTQQQAVVITLLHDSGDTHVYQKDLEREMELTNPAVTNLIKGMVNKGLVTRQKEEHDGRYFRLLLTDEGNDLYDAACEQLVQGNGIYEERLSAEELDTLEALLAKVFEDPDEALE